MPTIYWLREAFANGYDSGDVLSLVPDQVRAREERLIGGSYRRVFCEGVLPFITPSSRVLELGPGFGSWTVAILHHLPSGQLHTVDFQDVRPWVHPERYHGRLICHQTMDNSYACLPDDYFDFFWSFGVFCHNNIEHIHEILVNVLPKMKRGALAVLHYGDWEKLDVYGWDLGRVPSEFKTKPDDLIWWPRNNQSMMARAADDAGWQVISRDLALLGRDSIILLQKA